MIYNLSAEDFDAVVSVHLRGHFCTTRHACAYWRDEHKAGRPVAGRIINTSSASGVFGMVGQTSYAAAKAGIAAMTQVTSLEMSRYGVTVNAVCPTARTRLTESGRMGQTEAPTGWHLMHPDNVGPFVAFLSCDVASRITGQVFGVFGGVVQRYDGWAPAAVLQRTEPGPWDVQELIARSDELFGTAASSFASPMTRVAALIDRAEPRGDQRATRCCRSGPRLMPDTEIAPSTHTESATTYISEEMRACVGSDLDRRVSFPITSSDIRRWAVAVYYPELPPRRFWAAPVGSTYSGAPAAPEDFNPFAWLVAEPAGPPPSLRDPEEVLGIATPDAAVRLRDGMSVDYGVPMRPGDVITSVRRLGGYAA